MELILFRGCLITLFVIFSQAWVGNGSNAQSKALSAIRRVDFLNFTYHPTICNQELTIPPVVRVRQGQYKNSDAYYGVGKVIYGRLTGNNEWAIVHIGCGQIGANFGFSELFIYAIRNGHVQLMTSIDDDDSSRDYRRYYPSVDDSLWAITDTGIRVANNTLIIERFAGGSHACPKHIATFKYYLGEVGAGKLDEYGLVNCGAYPPVRGSNRMGNFSLYRTGCGAIELRLDEELLKKPANLRCG